MLAVREVYEKYQVPPWLQMHQVRVAAVGKMAADACIVPMDTDLVVRTCLVHDIGAIVKFDFSHYRTHAALQDLCPPDQVSHWAAVQEKMWRRYGTREHAATMAIMDELGITDVQEVFEMMGIQRASELLESGLRETHIALYSDLRVGPHGIVTIRERIEDISKRYAEYWEQEGRMEESKHYLESSLKLEVEIFKNASCAPEDITDEAAAPLIAELWDYAIA